MKIDKRILNRGLWYEDKDGNEIPHNRDDWTPPENAVTEHTLYPLEITEHISFKGDDGRFHEAYRCNCHIGRGNEDVILAMANSGDYTLGEAIILYSQACERCANVLAYKYLNGKDGYPEHSDKWKECNTVCQFCREESDAL